MKKYRTLILIIAITIAVFAVLDICIGAIFKYAYDKAQYGMIARQNYVINNANEDILIVGSSEVMRNYKPSLITERTGLTCCSDGSEGQCIYYSKAIIDACFARGYKPKLIICDVGNYDALKSEDSQNNIEAAVSRLAPNYGDSKAIRDFVAKSGKYERFKFLSHTYRFNSKIIQMYKCLFVKTTEDHGFEANFTKLDPDTKYEISAKEFGVIEKGKLDCIKELVQSCKENNVKIIFVHSPKYYQMGERGLNAIKTVLSEERVPYIDMNNEKRMKDVAIFADPHHLNFDGATIYSEAISKIILKVITN